MKPEPIKTIDLTVSRTIPGPPEEVYDVWLDTTKPGGIWYGVERAIVNLAVDGLFYHSVKHENRSWAHYGRFLRLERGRAIEHTWMSEWTRGLESVVSITLERRDGGTGVTLRHSNLPDDEMGRQHKDGWSGYLDLLVQPFQKVAAR
jgi:uncharacterized protein YndB with AHSA1/START domain